MVPDWVQRLLELNRVQKRIIVLTYDIVALNIALVGAFSTRLGVLYVPTNPLILLAAAGSCLVGVLTLQQLQVYRILLRFFDLRIVTRILVASAAAAGVWVVMVYLTNAQIFFSGIHFNVPRSVAFIYGGFAFLLLFMGRYAMASILTGPQREGRTFKGKRRNVAIYGANSAGISVAETMRDSREYSLRAFIDDDPALRGQVIGGVPIYPPSALERLAGALPIDEVLLALPRATRSQRLSAISMVSSLNLPVMTVPAPEEIVSGRFSVSDVRPIDVNDLLRREPVEPLTELIRDAVTGRSLLVTGAGGSIGSEICRQVMHAAPRTIVLFDHSEFSLYTTEQQLEEALQKVPANERPEVVSVVGSVLNGALVRKAISEHSIDSIYHAAAYKHVPLLENNEVVGVENNVVGTATVARAAFDAGITRFTLISTDKAVRPQSVMGASKRAAELIIQSLAEDPKCRTRFGIVRFGNVLDSSGSVVQRFRRQIRRGGPVTVTHESVTRFFMSIPEATQLVLQASAMAKDGEVFVLEMGEPVRIVDLARHMISLSGMSLRDEASPDGDISIEYVGLRPGEKLYEELFIGKDTVDTAHPRIRKARERSIDPGELEDHLRGLTSAIEAGDRQLVRAKLHDLVEPDLPSGAAPLVGAREDCPEAAE
jgi:UDP-N-acetylglucosamine 4,6-dehydratase